MIQPLHILNLENNQRDSELIQRVLTNDGIACTVQRVETREAFLEALHQKKFHLILSDYNLPSLDGLNALSLAREITPNIPLIYVSKAVDEEPVIKALNGGATDYIFKDSIARLPSVIRRVLRDQEEHSKQKTREDRIRLQTDLLDIDPDGIIVMDTTGRITFWNKGAEQLYGHARQDIIGKRIDDQSMKDMPAQYRKALNSVLANGRWEGEWVQTLEDGRELTISSRWLLVRDQNGKPESVYVVDSDITEKKLLEAQFLRSQRMEGIGTLAGGIAHDLNNVLGPIMIAIQILRKKLTSEEDEKLLNMLESVTKRGADMVKHILTFARGTEQERIEFQPKHLAYEIEQMVRETFPKNIDFRQKVATEPRNITGDLTQLNQVLLNLCVNARDAMPKGGQLSITIDNVIVDDQMARFHSDAKPGPYVVFSVADTGVGIPPHMLEKIFEPFYTTKAPGTGTGLGLSTSYGIVRNHGGFITVDTELGRGTVFKVYLPAAPLAASKTAEGDSPHLPAGHGETILVIDDETSILETTQTMLESFNYKVLVAADGDEGIVMASQHGTEIDAIVCDLNMPQMDGATTIRAMKKILPAVKVIATSGFFRNEEIIELKNQGNITFLQKPYPAQQLLSILAEIFKK